MPRRARSVAPDTVYHVLNRAAKRLTLFSDRADYSAFEELLFQLAHEMTMRLLCYCIMPNHWHLVLWPKSVEQMSKFMRRLTVTHALRWHAFHKTGGTGPVYQGRFKAIPVQHDTHLLQLFRYVERNPLRAGLVERAEDWNWCSLARRLSNCHIEALSEWPIPHPSDWSAIVNGTDSPGTLNALRRAVQRNAPYGDDTWVADTADALGLQSTLRARGRPKKDSRPLFSPHT